MALTVDTTIRYQSAPEGENFTFSLSKPLNQLTTADILTADAFAGFTSFAHNQLAEGVLGTGIPQNNPEHCYLWAASDPFGAFPSSRSSIYWSYPANFPDGVYMRNIFVYRPLNTGGGSSLVNTRDDVRIVLEITPDANTRLQKLEAVGGNNGPFIRVRYNNDANAETRLTDFYYISPAIMLVVNDVLYLYVQSLGVTYGAFVCWNTITAQGYSGGYQNFENSGTDHQLGLGWTRGLSDTSILTDFVVDSSAPYAGSGHISNVNFNGRTAQLNIGMSQSSGDIWHRSTITMELSDVAADKDITKMYMAFTGCRFQYDGTWYKPIVQGGIIVGYTDDMSVQSEWDTWTKATGHNVPSGGGDTGLKDDEQTPGGAYSSGGFIKMYACKKSELRALQSWLSGGTPGTGGEPVPENTNFMDQFIGLTGFPIEIPTGVGDATTFRFRTADNGSVNSGISTKTTKTGNQHYMTKSLNIPAWEGNNNAVPWMDYAATVECYVPFCGVVGLDPQVVIGHDVRVQMWVCFTSGDCSAYIECSTNGKWHPVAYVSGNLGAAEAMSSAAYGQLMGASAAASHQMTQAVIGGVKNAVTGTVSSAVSNYARAYGNNNLPVPAGQSAGLANAIASASGRIAGGSYGALAAITNAVDLGVTLTQQNLDNRYNYNVAKNSLGTTIAGSFGSQSSWHYPIMPYVKVTWPTPLSKDVTNYGHTYGVPVHKTGNLKDYHGYTVCNNVDTSGITTATMEEQNLIKQYLESGVYLP